MADKDIERASLELARSIHPEFPAGDPVDSESPDFLWSTGDLGLEVRRHFQPPSASRFAPTEIEGFRQTVIRQAEELYRDTGVSPVNVIVNFSGRDQHRQRAGDLARGIADFVSQHRPDEKQITFNDAGD